MRDALLTDELRKEALSRAYVHAVASRAGYVVQTPEYDTDGVDLEIRAGGAMRPAVDLQLKATVNLPAARSGYRRFPLKVNNYRRLRATCQTPCVLVVLDLPPEDGDWLEISFDALVLRRCAYWVSLRGCPETSNTSSVTVRIPMANRFDVQALTAIMARIRHGSAP